MSEPVYKLFVWVLLMVSICSFSLLSSDLHLLSVGKLVSSGMYQKKKHVVIDWAVVFEILKRIKYRETDKFWSLFVCYPNAWKNNIAAFGRLLLYKQNFSAQNLSVRICDLLEIELPLCTTKMMVVWSLN